MNVVTIKDFNLGGTSDSLFQGAPNSVAELVGFDLHAEPGILRVNQRLVKESDILVDDLVKCAVPCSDGNTYLFGSTNGKIWKRDSDGNYTYVATVAPAAGAVGVTDAKEYQGYIYYAMQNRLGRVAVGAPTDWTTRSDNWDTFANGDAEFHPMQEVSQVLYIGDENFVAQVDAGVFSNEALDIKAPLRVKALGTIFTDLLLGTFFSDYKVATEIFQWNTWSPSFSSSDPIPEIGINSFLASDNEILVSAGTKGNIYSYDGQMLRRYRRIPGVWTSSNEATIHKNATTNRFGLPLFGLSNISGNPAKQGVYSLGGYDSQYPDVLNLEWLISTGAYENVDIGVVESVGSQLIVSWKEQRTVTMTIAAPGIVTDVDHALDPGTPVVFSTTGALPTGVVAGTVYYAASSGDDTFRLYDTSANAILGGVTGRVTTSGSQSGVHTMSIFGVDGLNQGFKTEDAYFAIRVLNAARNQGKTLTGYVAYRELPAGTSIKVLYKAAYAAEWTEATCLVDSMRKIIEIKEALPEATTIQVKVQPVVLVNAAPEIESAEFYFE